jgi:hypothetical protein
VTRAIYLTEAAEKVGLACELRRRITHNLEKAENQKAFARMWGTVVLVCRGRTSEDTSPGFPSGAVAFRDTSSLTLRFDYGVLTIHEGRVGRPHLTLWGTEAQILSLNGLKALMPGVGFEVFGRGTHPRLAFRFGRLLDASN